MDFKNIFIIINKTNRVKLEVDSATYDNILANNEATKRYINDLMVSKIIDEVKIEHLMVSIDENTYYEVIEDSLEDEDHEDKKEQGTWSKGETKLLLDKYNVYLEDIGPMKKFKKKKDMWTQISKDLHEILGVERTNIQCENRFKTVLKRKKQTLQQNKKTGEEPIEIDFEEELEKTSQIDDSIKPEIRIGVGRLEKKKGRVDEDMLPQCSKKLKDANSRSKSFWETYKQIQKEKEENRERRHQEKLQLLKEIGNKMIHKQD